MKTLDELKQAEEKPKYRLRFGEGQFFAKKPNPEIVENDDDEEEEDENPKPKSDEEAPAWAQKLIDLVTPKESTEGTQKVPIPPAPPEPEEDDEEEEEPKPEPTPQNPVGKFLKWLL